jgi:hypothetical protein
MSLSADGTCSLYLSKQDEKTVPGILLATGKASNIAPNKWHTLMLVFSGSTIRGFVDRIQILAATDSTFSEGMVGLVTWSNNKTKNIALFDNLVVKSLGRIFPSPSTIPKKVHAMYEPITK